MAATASGASTERARPSYFDAYPNGIEPLAATTRLRPKRTKPRPGPADEGSSTFEGAPSGDREKVVAGALKHRASRSRLRDRLRSPNTSEFSFEDRPRSARSSVAGRDSFIVEADVLTPLSHPGSLPSSVQSSPVRARSVPRGGSRRSSARSSVGSSTFSPGIYAFPTAPADVDAVETSSASSISDLFAGPRTSVYFDPDTGELLSRAPDARAMDALVGTMRDSALPPEVRNMRRETREMQAAREERKREAYLEAARKKARRRKREAEAAAVLSQQRATPEVGLGLTTLSQPSLSHRRQWSNSPSDDSKFASSSSGSTSRAQHRDDGKGKSPEPRTLPATSMTPSNPRLARPQSRPDIAEEDEDAVPMRMIQPAPRPTAIAANGIPSIDEIVRSYAPMMKQPTTRKREPAFASPPGARSSMDSIADEVMRFLNVGFEEASRGRPSGATTSLLAAPDEPRGRKPSATRVDPTPSPLSQPHSLPPSETSADQELATYIRSPRLTTLLKLNRPANKDVTVSLADVGSPQGHPIIVFLGLGCVRYLVALYDEIAETMGLRLICVDRWGLGKTTDIPDVRRGFLEWSSVVEEVADRLDLDRFSLLAHSAGAPYALATALRLDHRVNGSVHLLAPFVSVHADGGANAGNLKWLRYVPTAMIKTAQAAEWKMQGWLLGKPPSLTLEPDEYDVIGSASPTSPSLKTSPLPLPAVVCEPATPQPPASESWARQRRTSQASDWSHLSRETSRNMPVSASQPSLGSGAGAGSADARFASQGRKGFLNKVLVHRKASGPGGEGVGSVSSSSTARSTTPTSLRSPVETERQSISSTWSAPAPPPPPPSRSHPGTLPRPGTKRMSGNSTISDKPSTLDSFSTRPTSPSSLGHSNRAIKPGGVATNPTPRPDLGTALLKASYAESLRGGTADLLAILERNDRPWGFAYPDVRTPVKVWHGDRDERIPLSSAKWMEAVMESCQLHVVRGADHSLMTNVRVMMEVLESLRLEWSPPARRTLAS